MRELLYTILELEEWNKGVNCSFCSSLNNKAICQIRTRSKSTDRILENDEVCKECKEKFENDELPKCVCGRLKTRYTCDCKEETQEKELPVLPDDRRPGAFYERQINGLREELNTVGVEIDTHLEALEIAEVWNKRQKQELLDKIKELEIKVAQLSQENKQLKKLNGIESYEKEITELKSQLVQLTSQQQTAKVEVPPKNGSIKGFFKLGGKK